MFLVASSRFVPLPSAASVESLGSARAVALLLARIPVLPRRGQVEAVRLLLDATSHIPDEDLLRKALAERVLLLAEEIPRLLPPDTVGLLSPASPFLYGHVETPLITREDLRKRFETLVPHRGQGLAPSPGSTLLGLNPYSTGSIFREHGKIAAAIWKAWTEGRKEEAQAIFNRWFYPPAPISRIADLGAGDGFLTVELAKKYPHAAVFAIDRDPTTLSEPDLPDKRIFNFAAWDFERFLEIFVRGSGGSFLFDRIYIAMPDGDFSHEAIEMVDPNGEIHLLMEDSSRIQMAIEAFAWSDFEARHLTIPYGAAPQTDHVRSFSGAYPYLHWVVARRRPSGVSLFPPPPPSNRPPFLPKTFKVMGHPIHRLDDQRFPRFMTDLFGRPMPVAELVAAFQVDSPGYHLAELSISRRGGRDILIEGGFQTDNGREAGYFDLIVPTPPPPGIPWVVDEADFYTARVSPFNDRPYATGHRQDYLTDHKQKGLGRSFHQRLFSFLARLGIDRVELIARYDGGFVWARLGFDFASSPFYS